MPTEIAKVLDDQVDLLVSTAHDIMVSAVSKYPVEQGKDDALVAFEYLDELKAFECDHAADVEFTVGGLRPLDDRTVIGMLASSRRDARVGQSLQHDDPRKLV